VSGNTTTEKCPLTLCTLCSR